MTRPVVHPSAPWLRIRAVTAVQWGLDPAQAGEALASPVTERSRRDPLPLADRFRFWPCSATPLGVCHATHPFA